MVRRVAIEAGEITLKYLEEVEFLDVDIKGNDTPVTKADREAEAYIQKALHGIIPDMPFVGEEAVAAGRIPDLSQEDYFWLVDPLDGTKEFIGGGGDYTVNIALIHKGEPVMGVVYAPAQGKLYSGHAPGSAMRWYEDSDKEKPISVRPVPASGMVVVASRSFGDNDKLNGFLEQFKVDKLIKRGSSIKICAIAAGRADMYPRFGPTCEWDTAAGHAVLRAAGGVLTDIDGKPLTYGGANPGFLNPEFIASSFKWFEGEDAA